MSNTIKRQNLGLILLLFLSVIIFIFSDFGSKPKVRVYDCGMAEWHPDIPKEVKEKCRELNKNKNLTLVLNNAKIVTYNRI